ncbi:MAG TPA: hypothetical protein VKU36_05985 [Candidatus Babeliales bacterium]|nr:hypothetical protein [Candidatus Babeliales bacterium]
MVKTNSLFLTSVTSFFLLHTITCIAMKDESSPNAHKAPKIIYDQFTRRYSYANKNENPDLQSPPTKTSSLLYTPQKYEEIINRRLAEENECFTKIKLEKEKRAEKEQEYELKRTQSATPSQQSTHAAPLLGSESDKAQAKNFEAQARFHDKQANSLKYNNTYIVLNDSAMIIAQLVAPSLSPALSPVLLELRQKIYKTAAEIDAEKTKNAYELANIKETEARELAAIAASLSQGSGQVQKGKGLEEVIESANLLAQLNLKALQDLEKRQKDTSELNEQLKKK